MSKKEHGFHLYNRIWFPIVTLLLVIATIWGAVGSFMPSSLALEQEVRCQLEEHVHTADCYVDKLLACNKKAHTHNENCYLILLGDNDINNLLTAVDNNESKSLEGVIDATLTQALAAEGMTTSGESLVFVGGTDPTAEPAPSEGDVSPDPTPSQGDVDPSPTPSQGDVDPTPSVSRGNGEDEEAEPSPVAVLSLTGTSLTALNDSITENSIDPALTLNANLYAANTVEDTLNNGISTLAVGDTPQTGTRAVNFYIQLDGKPTLVSSGTLTDANPDYYSYANAVAAYKANGVITALTTNNINSTYFFRYNTNGSVANGSNFNSNAGYYNNQLQFGNNSSARYVILTTRSGASWNRVYTPVPFWTVTLDYSAVGGDNQVRYVQNGQNASSELSLDPTYEWVDGNGNTVDASALQNITAKTTLYAKLKDYIVTFHSNGGSAVPDQTVTIGGTATQPNAPTRTGYQFNGWYLNADGTGEPYNFSTPVNSNMTLYAGWTAEKRTIQYYDSSNNLLYSDAVDYGSSYDLRNSPNGQVWFSGDNIYAGTIDPVTSDLTLTAGVVATFSYANGTVVRVPARPGTVITLRTDGVSGSSLWADDQGNTYQPGDTYTLNASTGFVEQQPLTIIYNLNFPDSGLADSDSTPKLAENGQTTATVEIPMGSSATIYSASPRTYISSISGEAAHFKGWVPASDSSALIQPGTNLTWDILNQYAVDGVITLNGDWNRDGTNNITDVRFFVRFDSVPPDTTGNVGSYATNFYTAQVYHSYAGNAPAHNSGFNIADKTPDNSYTADQTIRALVGDKGDGTLWISGVPDDEWLFEQLKEFTWEHATEAERNDNQYLRIYIGDDAYGNPIYERVSADELDTSHYALRWYVFKKESDGWHIDGRLVKKEGTITVDKTFGGLDDAVAQAREGFYILAENGTVENGVFTPYPGGHSKYNTHILVLDHETEAALTSQYPYAIFQVYDQEVTSKGETIDEWLITQVELNEYWQFTEKAVRPTYTDTTTGETKYYSWYAEYTISDSDGEYSEIAKFGSVASVIGKTYALDMDADQGLTLDFINYYYSNESILIRKIDGDTGLPLGGAEFQLWQGGQQLKFTDSGNGIYSVDPTGSIGSISTNSEGFSVITVDSFSYENGELVVKEVTAPTGYAVVNNITVDYLNGVSGEAGITGIVGADPSEYDYHAEYYDENGGILVVKDHAAVLTSVTVNKVWAEAVTEDSVTVVLQADGSRATNLFPNLPNVEITLSSANSWTYTWQQLPAYANGKPVSWSVKEVRIGTETTMVGSDTFANWIVVYSTPVQTDFDNDGITDNWSVTVTNTVRRTMINGIKTCSKSGAALSGALFTLTEVEWNSAAGQWVDKAGSSTLTAESGSDGRLLFDGLTAGAFYRLTETRAPNGYMVLPEPVYLTVNGMGVIYGAASADTLDTGLVSYTGPYVITIQNVSPEPLPETGGPGTQIYTQTGALLMAAALILFVYEKRRREGIPDA